MLRFKKTTLLSLLLIVIVYLSSCGEIRGTQIPTPPVDSQSPEIAGQTPPQSPRSQAENLTGTLKISYLDVGQGDCIFINLPNGESVLIDAGERENGAQVVQYIKDSGEDTLDYVIATHPHADHIGGMGTVLSAFAVKDLYMPDKTHTTQTFEDLLSVIAQKGLGIQVAKAGKVIFDYGNVKAEFIGPCSDGYGELNNYSAVVLLSYNGCRFLFMGDAEAESETEILLEGYDVRADILKAGHHGSDTSSTGAFVEKVGPRYAVISCGEGNAYGHPDAKVLERMNRLGVEIHRTDLEGTIVAVCDGESIRLES